MPAGHLKSALAGATLAWLEFVFAVDFARGPVPLPLFAVFSTSHILLLFTPTRGPPPDIWGI